MIDFTPIINKQISWKEFSGKFTREKLVDQVNQITDHILDQISGCTDADAVFQPIDPEAHDPFTDDADEENMSWNLGHVIMHITASCEESGFVAAELARGVEFEERRSRWEVPWQSITKIGQCRHRLNESRRMQLASLELWPDDAHLENFYKSSRGKDITPIWRFLYGQYHADQHLAQIGEIVRQAKEKTK